jgi:hypothetical protein
MRATTAARRTAGSWKSDPVLLGELAHARMIGVASAGKAKVLKGDRIGQIVGALASGRAVYANLAIDGRAWGYRGVRNGVLAPYAAESRGGHAVSLIGYRTLLTGRQFLIQNSWGKDWGADGYVWISEAELRRHLHDAFVLDARLPPGVTSNPLPQQTPFFLPPIQQCPSGLPMVMGQCWLG